MEKEIKIELGKKIIILICVVLMGIDFLSGWHQINDHIIGDTIITQDYMNPQINLLPTEKEQITREELLWVVNNMMLLCIELAAIFMGLIFLLDTKDFRLRDLMKNG